VELEGTTALRRGAHQAYSRAINRFRANPRIYRLLFGHWPARGLKGQLWDWTTLALASALRRHVRPGSSVLDVGTGPAGVLAIYAKCRLSCGRAYGVDHVPELLRSAAATAEQGGVKVEFSCSQLFTALGGRFDVIAFNAPYIPVSEGRRLGVLRSASDERRWGGGDTGLETIDHFLKQAPDHLTPSGRILLGVNHFYLRPEAVRLSIEAAHLPELDRIHHRLSRACVYVLGARARERERAAPLLK
jgi:methylase of polypeptide subunit release factors